MLRLAYGDVDTTPWFIVDQATEFIALAESGVSDLR
jgi:hypothetical protein